MLPRTHDRACKVQSNRQPWPTAARRAANRQCRTSEPSTAAAIGVRDQRTGAMSREGLRQWGGSDTVVARGLVFTPP